MESSLISPLVQEVGQMARSATTATQLTRWLNKGQFRAHEHTLETQTVSQDCRLTCACSFSLFTPELFLQAADRQSPKLTSELNATITTGGYFTPRDEVLVGEHEKLKPCTDFFKILLHISNPVESGPRDRFFSVETF